jgi:signal transduction histidine kinase
MRSAQAEGGDPQGRRVAAAAEIAAAIAHSEDLDAALSRALDAAIAHLQMEAGGLFLVDDGGILRGTPHHRGLPSHYPDAVSRFAPGEGVVGRALLSVEPVVVDAAAAADVREATREIGLRTVVFVPLYARGRAVGLMALGNYSPREFHAEELQLLTAMGGMLGAAIDNAKLVGRSGRHLVQVQALWEIDKALVEDRDLTEVFGTIAREAARLVDGEAVIVLLDGNEDLKVAGAEGPRALELLGDPPSLAGTPLAAYLAGTAPMAVPLRRDDPRQAIVVPLKAAERTLGALVLVRAATEWSEEELTTLATFGRRAAMALARADARLAEERRASQLALLAGASEIAASTLDVDVLLGSIARYVQRSFGYYSVAIYLVHRETRDTVLAGSAGAAATILPKGHRMPFGTGIIGWVAERGEPILANDIRREPRYVATRLAATLSELAVPVRLAGQVVAVINVESDRLEAFDEGDMVAVDGIASQVASAIQNARLFDEKVRALRNLEILQEVTNVLNTELELDVLLDRIARRSVEAVRAAQRGAVLLYDGQGLRVRSSHGYLQPAALQMVHLAFHEALPGSVFVSGQGRLVTGADASETHPGFVSAAAGAPTTSALCAPIALPREKLGVLLLESGTTDTFDADDLRFASTLAAQAAIAVGNALHVRRIVEMDRQRQEYLSNVSHELRTPLTVVQGYVEAVSDGTAGSRSGEYLRIAHDHCQRLARMIDEVLHVARLEQGVAKRHLEWAPVSLSEVVKGVVRGQRAEAMAKGVKLNARLADVPVLTGDHGLLQSLVFHLIENAVKFTAAGGHVEVALESLKDEVHFRVKDDGIGIPADLHGRVFEKFFMVDASPSKAQGGAGIGLYLAREVAAIHGGHIELRSAPGEGSVFEVCLPVRPRVA